MSQTEGASKPTHRNRTSQFIPWLPDSQHGVHISNGTIGTEPSTKPSTRPHQTIRIMTSQLGALSGSQQEPNPNSKMSPRHVQHQQPQHVNQNQASNPSIAESKLEPGQHLETINQLTQQCHTLYGTKPEIYKCVPQAWLWMPPTIRKLLGWMYLLVFCGSFGFINILPGMFLCVPYTWIFFPKTSSMILTFFVITWLLPRREWVAFRKLGQLWYEIFDFHCNLSDADRQAVMESGNSKHFIVCSHPHSIIPLHGVLWSAYCDQYLPPIYGFGCSAEMAKYTPVLGNILHWLASGSATYQALRAGLVNGYCPPAHNSGRQVHHLFILAGGVAEIFTCSMNKHVIVYRKRRGLIRLALETGAYLVPSYTFGATELFHHDSFATATGSLGRKVNKFWRKVRVGVTFFHGQFGLPVIPYTPRVTLILGEPVVVEKYPGDPSTIPSELIEQVHERYLQRFTEMFYKYRAVCGYPDAELEIQ